MSPSSLFRGRVAWGSLPQTPKPTPWGTQLGTLILVVDGLVDEARMMFTRPSDLERLAMEDDDEPPPDFEAKKGSTSNVRGRERGFVHFRALNGARDDTRWVQEREKEERAYQPGHGADFLPLGARFCSCFGFAFRFSPALERPMRVL
ncbi:MAG: hypothetical protein ACRDJL_11105 [Actinomycetota bacterium]